jgi:1,4-dihydroxy-2-naphthoate octaprenyltransferase
MLQIAAPHTWPAGVLPPLLAYCLAIACGYDAPVEYALLLLIICVLLQSAVNSINDYFDCVKGSDSADDNLEADDAVLIYNDINPKEALIFAIGCVVLAFAFGAFCIIRAGIAPLIIALIGVACVFLYSGGHTPISYLPIGEIVSGVVMGGLMTLASLDVLTCQLNFMAIVWSLPLIISIALIMFTNNTCDIDKDIQASRKTLSVVLGHKKARRAYRTLMIAGVIIVYANIVIFFPKGLPICIFGTLACIGPFKALWKNPLIQASRIAAMGQACMYAIMVGAFYSAAILASAL